MDQSKIKAKEDEDSGGDGSVQAAVRIHHVINPVARAEIHDHATDIPEY
jgi:hypothetical protein